MLRKLFGHLLQALVLPFTSRGGALRSAGRTFPSTLILSTRNFSNDAISMILSSTGLLCREEAGQTTS